MSIGDDEDEIDGTEGQGTEGQDTPAGDEKGGLPAEHADPEADDGEQEVDGDEGGRRPSRGEARFQRLANETKAAREEAAAARREAEELRRQSWQQNSQVTAAQKAERRSLMTPDERAAEDIAEIRSEVAQQRQQDRMQTQATMDKVAYDAKATIDPVYAKFKDEVESRFADQMRQGRPVEREIILKLLLGERALSGARDTKARKQGAGRVASQKVAPGSGKGDAASERGKAGDTPEKRLQGVYI